MTTTFGNIRTDHVVPPLVEPLLEAYGKAYRGTESLLVDLSHSTSSSAIKFIYAGLSPKIAAHVKFDFDSNGRRRYTLISRCITNNRGKLTRTSGHSKSTTNFRLMVKWMVDYIQPWTLDELVEADIQDDSTFGYSHTKHGPGYGCWFQEIKDQVKNLMRNISGIRWAKEIYELSLRGVEFTDPEIRATVDVLRQVYPNYERARDGVEQSVYAHINPTGEVFVSATTPISENRSWKQFASLEALPAELCAHITMMKMLDSKCYTLFVGQRYSDKTFLVHITNKTFEEIGFEHAKA